MVVKLELNDNGPIIMYKISGINSPIRWIFDIKEIVHVMSSECTYEKMKSVDVVELNDHFIIKYGLASDILIWSPIKHMCVIRLLHFHLYTIFFI